MTDSQNNLSSLASHLCLLPGQNFDTVYITAHRDMLIHSQAFFDHCDVHGIAPLVYYNLKTLGLDHTLSPQILQAFKRAYYRTLSHNLLLNQAILTIGTQLTTHFPVILLKGPVLIHHIYKNPAFRPMTDLDLLVHPDDFNRVKHTLQSIGYSPSQKYADIFFSKNIVLDLHEDPLNAHRIAQRKKAVLLDPLDLWQNATPIPDLPPYHQLSLNHQIITLSNHALKHGFARKIWLIDILLCLHLVPQNLQAQTAFLTQCHQAHAFNILQMCLFAITSKLVHPLPEWAKILQKSFPISPTRLKILHTTSHTDPFQILEPLILFDNLNGFGAKCHFLWEMAFPRREILSQISGFSNPLLFWLSYPYRIYQLTTKGFVQIIRFLCRFLFTKYPKYPEN